MKTICHTSVLLISLLLAVNGYSEKVTPPLMRSIHIVFSAKAYWDGTTKSCTPREKGGCCHIWTERMVPGPGEIVGEMVLLKDKIILMTVSRSKGMNNETWRKYFSEGKFNFDGPITFDPEVLLNLGIDRNYILPASDYPYAVNGDNLTITFK